MSDLQELTSRCNLITFRERATDGGLLITEATPVSIRASGLFGVPGTFTTEQQDGWKEIVDSVHLKGGVFFCQIWHQGRNTHSILTGQLPESSSAVPIEADFSWAGVDPKPFEVPHAMSVEEIQATQDDFVQAAKNAVQLIGFDGVEVHAGNGYIFDQFHHSNINQRTDKYGGSIEKRCLFTLETVDKLCAAIGPDKVGVRLSPFGLFNQANGEQRMEQWTYLCSELSKRGLAYVHLIEPRFDELRSEAEKSAMLGSIGGGISLAPFRRVLGDTPLLVAGGYGPDNFKEGIQKGEHDLVAFGRYFVSNPDLVERLRLDQPLYRWVRARFYGPFPDNEIGYTVHTDRELAKLTDRSKAQLAE